jgi:hypothetical protein
LQQQGYHAESIRRYLSGCRRSSSGCPSTAVR